MYLSVAIIACVRACVFVCVLVLYVRARLSLCWHVSSFSPTGRLCGVTADESDSSTERPHAAAIAAASRCAVRPIGRRCCRAVPRVPSCGKKTCQQRNRWAHTSKSAYTKHKHAHAHTRIQKTHARTYDTHSLFLLSLYASHHKWPSISYEQCDGVLLLTVEFVHILSWKYAQFVFVSRNFFFFSSYISQYLLLAYHITVFILYLFICCKY